MVSNAEQRRVALAHTTNILAYLLTSLLAYLQHEGGQSIGDVVAVAQYEQLGQRATHQAQHLQHAVHMRIRCTCTCAYECVHALARAPATRGPGAAAMQLARWIRSCRLSARAWRRRRHDLVECRLECRPRGAIEAKGLWRGVGEPLFSPNQKGIGTHY